MTRQSVRLLAAALLLIAAAPCQAQSRGQVRKTPLPAAQSSPSAPPASPAAADRSRMLTIESPAEGSHLKASSIAVRVRAGDAVVNLSVNGVSASRDADGVFVASPVALPEGPVTLTAAATDRAGRVTTSAVHVTADRTPPRVAVFAAGSALSSGAALKRGTRLVVEATDLAPVDLKAALNGQPFVSGMELRQEGNYTLEIDAADRAGNRTRRSLSFHVQTRAPELARLSPATGAVLASATVTVSGECEDAEEVTVAGITASVYGRRFVASAIPLALGDNNINIVARDAAGNQSRASLKLIRDDAAPKLTIPATSGSVTRDASIVVRGTVEDQTLAEVSVNGIRATLPPLPPGEGRGERRPFASHFQARVPLVEGPNRLTIVARDAAGNRTEKYLDAIRATAVSEKATASSAIAVDAAIPQLVSFDPADGSRELPTALVPRLRFSKPIDRASVTDSAVRLVSEPEGEAVAATLFVEGKEVALLPSAVLAEKTAYRLEVSASLADSGGNRLREGRTVRFTTGRATPPPAPQIDSFPAATCAASVLVSGKADPGSRIRVEGGAELQTSVADDAGRFSIPVPLAIETVQALSVVAVDSANRSSQPVVRPVRRDCTPPRVERVKLEATGLEIVFSEPIDPKSIGADGAIVFTRRPEGVIPSPRMQLDATGRIARFEESEALREGRTSITIGRGVTDLAGNSLPAPFVTLAGAAALAVGQAGLSGQVFDDRIGRPIAGAVVTVVAVNGVAPTPPAPSTTTATDGSFSLVVPTGEIALRASQSGYAAALRISTVAAGDSITVFDVRLTPETLVTAAANGSAAVTDAELSLTLPASAVAAGSTVRAASVSPQGIAALQPLGWSPAAALSLEAGAASVDPTTSVTFPAPASASWDNRWGYPAGTSLLLARLDVATRRYVSLGPATLGPGATKINASIPSTGAFVVFVADLPPTAPPQPSVGQPLAGVATPATDPIVSATITSTPADVLPSQTADILGKLTLSAAAPSGYPVEVLVSETLTLLNNQQVQVPSFLEDLTVLRDGTGQTIVPFRVRPSSTAAQVALSVGYENLTVRHYTVDLTRGNLIGTGGGTVTGPAGFSLVIPASALSQTVPVSLTQVNAPDVPVAIPAGYHLIAAVQLALGGPTLTQPATLKWASTTDPTGSGLIWVEVATINGITRPRFVNPGRYDSINKLVETTPAAVHNLPVPGVLAGDIYLLLGANQATSYVKGKVFDVDSVTPVASAVVTEDNTTLVAMSDGTGAYALAIPASGVVVRSSRIDTGNVGQATVPAQAAGAVATKDIPLAVTAPYVVSIAPATASPLPLDLPVVFTLSEPLSPATVGANAVTALVGTTPIPGTARLSITGTQITFSPTGSWPGKAALKLTLSSLVTDRQGYRLVDQTTKAVADYVVTYNTVDPTPPSDINPLLIYMTVPAGSPPSVTITGTSGAACAGCTVIAVNDTTTATATTTALSNGSFTLTLTATTTDRVYVLIRRSSGGEIRVDPGPYRADGGRTAYLGPRAADYVTADGIRVTVDQGSFSLPVTLRVAPIAQSALPAPMPTQSTFIAGISFDPGSGVSANKPIDIAVAAPPGVTGGQFLVARAVEVAGETKWMVVDTARYDNGAITTRPSGATGFGIQPLGESVSVLGTTAIVDCPELNRPGGSKEVLDRVTRKSNLIILGVTQQLAYAASVVISPNAAVSLLFSGQFEMLGAMLPYVWVVKEAKQQCYFVLPVPLNVPLTFLGRDATSGLTIFQGNFSPVTDPTNIAQVPPTLLTGSIPAPRLIDASPFKAYTFVPAPADVEKPFLTQMTYTYKQVASVWTLTVIGKAGAVENGADLTLVNNNAPTIATKTGTAASDGTFTIFIAANLGDDVTFLAGTKSLAPDARIHLLFSEPLDLPSVQQTTLNGGALEYDVVPDNGTRGFTLVPKQLFVRGAIITLNIPATTTTKLPKALSVKLSSSTSNLIGPRDVRDVNALYLKGGLLLEVTGTAGNIGDPTGQAKLNLYDASDPGAIATTSGTLPKLCSSLPLYDFARGVIMDDHDRVLVSMGGGGTNGRVQVFRLTPPGTAGTALCAGRTLVGEGPNPSDLNLAWTEVTVRAGAGDLGVLPEGFPGTLTLLNRESVQTFALDRDQDPIASQYLTRLTVTRTTNPPDTKQLPNSPFTVSGDMAGTGIEPSPQNQPVTLANLTTGASWTYYPDRSGSFTIVGKASSGDRMELRVNAAQVSIVGTVGFGFQGIDVNKTVHLSGQDCGPFTQAGAPCGISKRLLFSYGRLGDLSPPLCRDYDLIGNCVDAIWRLDRLDDMALLPKPEAPSQNAIPAPGYPDEPTVLAAISHFGLATFSLTGDGEGVRINQLGPGIHVGTLGGAPVYPSLIFALGAQRGWPVKPAAKRTFCKEAWKDSSYKEYLPTLAFLATSSGLFVVDVTKASVGGADPNGYGDPHVIGSFDMPAGASATNLALDPGRGLVYVGATGTPGTVSVYDMTDPCTPGGPAGSSDPRRMASVDIPSQNPNAPFVVDPETGMVFGAGDSSSGGNGKAFAVALFPPPLRFVADTDRDGRWEDVGSAIPLGARNPKKPAAPYAPDVVRILANIFGGAGTKIVVELAATTPEGAAIAATPPGFPATKRYVKLTRQSDDPADPGYNRYFSPPIVLIADPRAQKRYAASAAEKLDTKEFACHNCEPDGSYGAELTDLTRPVTPTTDGHDRANPIDQPFEFWTGERLVVRLAEDINAENTLKAKAQYLSSFDLQRVRAEIPTVRADFTPGLRQSPRLNPSSVADEAGSETILSSGELQYSFRDLFIAGRGLSFALDRFYASQALHFGPFGRSWDSPIFARLRSLPSGDVDFFDGTGRRETFHYNDQDQTFDPPAGRFAELYRGNDLIFILRERNGTLLKFDPQGRLISISDAIRTDASETSGDGNRLRFFYDPAGRLIQMRDALDHPIQFEYHPDGPPPPVTQTEDVFPGLLSKITDHTGRTVEYRYDGNGRLTKVSLPELTHGTTQFAGASRPSRKYAYVATATPQADFRRFLLESDNLDTIKNARQSGPAPPVEPPMLKILYGGDAQFQFGGSADAVVERQIAGKSETFAYDPTSGSGPHARHFDRRGHEWQFTHLSEHPIQKTLASNDVADSNTTNPFPALTLPAGTVSAFPLAIFERTSYDGQDGLLMGVQTPEGVSLDYNYWTPTDSDRRLRGNVKTESLSGILREEFDYEKVANKLKQHTLHTDPSGTAVTLFARDPQKSFLTGITYPHTVGWDPVTPPQLQPVDTFGVKPDTGQRLSETDLAGVTQTYDYFLNKTDPQYGYLQAIKLGAGGPSQTSITFARDARGNVTKRTNARGHDTNYDPNEADWVVSEATPAALVQKAYRYDEDGNLIEERWRQDPLVGDVIRTYQYDSLNRRTKMTVGGQVAPVGNTTYEYDSVGNLQVIRLPLGDAIYRVYDARNLLVGEARVGIDGTHSSFHTYKRDRNGRVSEESDNVNTTTLVQYDSSGRPNLITTPRGLKIEVTYDVANRPTLIVAKSSTNQVLKQRQISYAENGQVYLEKDTLDQSGDGNLTPTTSYFYDNAARRSRTVDPRQKATLFEYDDHGRFSAVTDPENNRSTFEYDADGNLLKRHDLDLPVDSTIDRVTERVYDALNRVTLFKDPLTHPTSYVYDQVGNVRSVTDALTHTTSYGYDDRGRRLTMVDAIGNLNGGAQAAQHRTTWGYENDDRVASLTDAESKITSYVYDKIGRLSTITYHDTKHEDRTWNDDGTVKTIKDPNNVTATFLYDADDQPNTITYTPTPTLGVTKETYGYDLLGRLTSATATKGGVGGTDHTTARTYDFLDRMISETQDTKTLNVKYDAAGNPIEQTYPTSNRKFTRGFDGLDRLTSVQDTTATPRTIRNLEYFGANRLKRESFGNVDQTYAWDASRRLTSITATKAPSTQLAKFLYGWKDDDVPTSIQRDHEGSKGDALQHDEDHRLTLAALSQPNPTGTLDTNAPNRQELTLGAVHERTLEKLVLGGVTTNNTATPNARYGYTAYGGVTRTYDSVGNLTGRGTDVFKWDARHRLVEANLPGGVKVEFGYDALGRRVERKKTVSATSTTSIFVFDGWNAIQEVKDGTLFRESVFGEGLDSALEYRVGGHDYDILRDASGSTTTVIKDDSTVQLFKYLPFGKGSILTGTTGVYNFDLSSATTTSLWQGLDLDPDLNWYYARNRWYDPDIGAFVSTDPLGYPDSANAYVWGISSPWGHDPMGLADPPRSSDFPDLPSEYNKRLADYREWYGDVYTAHEKRYDTLRAEYLRNPTMQNLSKITNDWESEHYAFLSGATYDMVVTQAYWSVSKHGKGFLDLTNEQLFIKMSTLRQDVLLIGSILGVYRQSISFRAPRYASKGVGEPRPAPAPAVAGENGNLEAGTYEGAAESRAAAPKPRGSANPETRRTSAQGRLLHQDKPGRLPDQLREMFPESEFRFRPEGAAGQDVEFVGGRHPSTYPGSSWPAGVNYGDFKPGTAGGRKTFRYDQSRKWKSPTVMLPYDPNTGTLK